MDHILVHQKKEFMEFFNSLEEANQYSVLDGQGALLFHAVERSNFFARNLIGKTRGFTMNFMNPQMQNVVMMKRALRCGLLAMCTQKCCELVTVSLTQGADIGTVEQILPSCCSTRMFFGIKDETGEVRLRIKYPPGMGCCSDMQFELVDMEGNVLGEIRKKWGGFMKEAFTQADNFGITFPIDLDVKLKFLLVSACLLLVSPSIGHPYCY